MNADFDTIASYYDEMYIDEDEYKKEAEKIITISKEFNKSGNSKLLDIGCGTGEQTKNLAKNFEVVGIDLSETMLKKARQKVPYGKFYQKNMFEFKMDEQYGVAINLFGSIGFANDYKQLVDGLRCTCECLAEGGILILTPWDTLETFEENMFHGLGESDSVKCCYMECVKRVSHNKVGVDMYHLIGIDNKINQYEHKQQITLFGEKEYLSAIQVAGFDLIKRLSIMEFRMGAFICKKPVKNIC